MHERCICPTCGRPHNKRKVIDYSARAKKAAGARWSSSDQDNVSPAVIQELKELGVVTTADKLEKPKRIRRTDLCEHKVEIGRCATFLCKEILKQAETGSTAG